MKSDLNKTVSEVMESYSVMVNGGSGVLVNAMTQDYSYVLTAAHVLTDKVEDNVVRDYQGNTLRILEVLTYLATDDSQSDLPDCAIIKIPYQISVEQRCFNASNLPVRTDLTLVGYPETERRSLAPVKHYDGHMTSVSNELVILTINGVPGTNTIRGMSGGGVYHIQDGNPFLVGVEFQMDGSTEEQRYGRVQCHSLVRFEELIKAHANAPIVPAHLECFSYLRKAIFSFNVIDQNNVHDLKASLEKFADLLIANAMPPPYEIMRQYDLELLVDPKQPEDLKTKELWIAYLEFLVICALLDNVDITDNSYIKDTERKRRLLYSNDSKNWISRLEELLKTARKLLDKGGTLIIASPESAAAHLPPEFLLERVINDIAIVPNQGPFSIADATENSIYTSFKLTHLEGLRKNCVIDSEFEYKNVQPGLTQLELLRNKLNEIIS